jgi:hypothetical protein
MGGRRRTIARRRLYVALSVGLATWMVAHFTMIAFHLLPANAITLLHPEFVAHYVHPFFQQNWHLFAPTPPTSNTRPILQLSLRPKGQGQAQKTEWFDIVSKLRAKMWANPLAPEVTRARTIRTVFIQYGRMQAVREKFPGYETMAPGRQATRVFNRLLVVLAEELFDPEQFELEAVRAQLVVEEIPPFSESQTPDYVPKILGAEVYEWFPPDRSP